MKMIVIGEKDMKKIVMCVLVFSTMFLVACNGMSAFFEEAESVDETVNQEESDALSEEISEDVESEGIMESSEQEENTDSSEPENASDEVTGGEEPSLNEESEVYFDMEFKVTDNPRIAEILNVSGTYTDSVGNVDNYHYRIPQFNADSESAKALNERIMYDVIDEIQDEFFCMDNGYSLFCYNISYEVIENGDVVAILVSVPYPNDCMDYYAYTYDFGQDKEISNAELLAMFEWTEEAFIEEACRREKEHFKRQIENMYPDMTEEDINYYIHSAVTETTVDLPMYIGSDGMLYVYLPVPSVAGAEWYYGLESF